MVIKEICLMFRILLVQLFRAQKPIQSLLFWFVYTQTGYCIFMVWY